MARRKLDAATDMTAASVDWRRAVDALAAEVARVTGLLRLIREPEAPAVGQWTLAEVAMHLSQAWIVVPGLAADDLSDIYKILPNLEGTADAALLEDVWELGGVTTAGVDGDLERDTNLLADRIEQRARAFLERIDARSIDEHHSWLVNGVNVTTLTLVCHLLNETIVHGYDIARADGRRWPISRSHAALVLDGFVVPVIAGLGPRTVVDQEAAAGLQATFEIHFRGGGHHLFTFDDGTLVIQGPGPGPVSRRVDCHISADPAAFLLVTWGRRSQWPAIGRGQITAWGRKPWLGPRFRTLMRNP
jgi:hypothetical protein